MDQATGGSLALAAGVALSPVPVIAVVPVHPPWVTRAAERRMTIRHAGHRSGE